MIVKPKWYDYFMLPYLWTRIMLLERTNSFLAESKHRIEVEFRLRSIESELVWHRKLLKTDVKEEKK